MKKLLISNIVTAIIVLGIIAAYSFSKPEQKAGAKYATVTITYSVLADIDIIISSNGKSEEVRSDKKFQGPNKLIDYQSELDLLTQQQLEELDTQGYQIVATDIASTGVGFGKRTYTLRKP